MQQFGPRDQPGAPNERHAIFGQLEGILAICSTTLVNEHLDVERRHQSDQSQDYSADSLNGFVADTIAPGATVVSDGWSGCAKLKDVKHDAKVIGNPYVAGASGVSDHGCSQSDTDGQGAVAAAGGRYRFSATNS